MKRRQVLAIGGVSLLLAVVAGAGGTAQTAAQGESLVREAVVSKLAPDGTKLSTFVSQLVQLRAEGDKEVKVEFPDGADLNSYRNLSGFSSPDGEGGDLVWKTTDDLDKQILAKVDKDLPVSIDISYHVNGKEVQADDLSGKSGKLTIDVEIENISGESKSVEHEATTSPLLTSVVDEYVPVEYIVRVTFPNNRWSKVGGEDIVVQPVDRDSVASANGVLTPPFGESSATASFEGTSDDIMRPRIQVFATPKVSQRILDSLQTQFEALNALYGGVGTISDNLESVYEGTLELVSGAEQLIDGVGENKAGTPVVALDSAGLPTTVIGTLGFIGAAFDDQILPGVDELGAGVADQILPRIGAVNPDNGEGYVEKDEDGNVTTLIGSLQSQKDTYDEQLIPGMKQLIDGVDQLTEGVEGGEALVDGVDQLRSGMEALINQLDPTFRGGLLQVSGGLNQVLGGLQTDNPLAPGLKEGLDAVEAGLTQLIASLQTNNPGTPGFREALLGLQAAADGGAAATADPVAAATFTAISAGLGELITNLGANGGSELTVIGGLEAMLDGISTMVAAVGHKTTTGNPAPPASLIGGIEAMSAGMAQLLAGLGDKTQTPSQLTIIGALQLMHAGLLEAGPGAEQLVSGVLGALELIRGGMTNPNFNKPQAVLDGMTPKEYFQECPGCFDPEHKAFDPATADPSFQPRFLEVFNLFSEGIEAGLPQLDSLTDEPGLRDGLEQVAEGINKQLKDGLVQVADGLDTLADKLHTGDADDPGLRDGLDLVHGGLQQVNQGIFALNELGLRTMRGQVGDQGDTVGRYYSVLQDKADELGMTSALGATADDVSTTYVFDSAAQSTATRDNLVRGSLMALALALMAVLAHRPRVFDI